MKTNILRYNVVIRKEGKQFIADVPTLGISDFGQSLEVAKRNIRMAIECHIEGLVKTSSEVPRPDTDDYYMSVSTVQAPLSIRFAQ